MHHLAPFVGGHVVVAHQGGWDEFLFVAAPILVVVGLLRVAGARSRRIQRERTAAQDSDAHGTGPGPADLSREG